MASRAHTDFQQEPQAMQQVSRAHLCLINLYVCVCVYEWVYTIVHKYATKGKI